MANYMNFNNMLSDLESTLKTYEKQAAESPRDEAQIRSSRINKEAPVPKSEETDDTTDLDNATPSGTDDHTKSVSTQINDNAKDTKVVDKTIKSDAAKMAGQSNQLLQKVYQMLNKSAKHNKQAEEQLPEDAGDPSAGGDGGAEAGIEGLSDEEKMILAKILAEQGGAPAADASGEAVDPSMSPEEEQEVKTAAVKSKRPLMEVKAEYIASRHEGEKFGQELMKMASLGFLQNPQLDEIVSYAAGQMIADMEKKGQLIGPVMLQKMAEEREQAEQYEKQAANQQMSPEQTYELIKQASAATCEAVIQDVLKQNMGQAFNEKMAGVRVNP